MGGEGGECVCRRGGGSLSGMGVGHSEGVRGLCRQSTGFFRFKMDNSFN